MRLNTKPEEADLCGFQVNSTQLLLK